MKRSILPLLLAYALFGVLGAGCGATPSQESSKTYLVVAKEGALNAAIAEVHQEAGILVNDTEVLPNLGAMFVTMTPSKAAELAKQTDVFAAIGAGDGVYTLPESELLNPDPVEAELNAFDMNESDIATPPGVLRLGAAQAWAAGVKGDNVSVCVVDTGIDYNHPDLKDQFVDGADFTNTAGNKRGMDDHRHGTHCAGTIAGKKTGMAPNAKLYAAKVLSRHGGGTTKTVTDGIEWCLEKNTNIISMSLGGGPHEPAFAELIKRVRSKGVQVVAAAGNDGWPKISYPAAYPGANAIGALGTDEANKPFDADEKASFSNWGPELFVAAPGVRVLSTVLNGKYEELSGTSMATPHIAGLVALMQSAALAKEGKLMTPAEVDLALRAMSWGRELGLDKVRNDKYGFGIPNISSLILRLNRLKTANFLDFQ